ncbi:MAG: GGDEF domain-containing protein [Candidatus Berkelbacteria bacterium]|nr:MAG: GGDEF domain-containing protein [Candidatus Berkelbacteria bacterium]QQG51924.1 MAG: GGDEF domain-containing protein [Candidatus Berkelbacteria bacterium]
MKFLRSLKEYLLFAWEYLTHDPGKGRYALHMFANTADMYFFVNRGGVLRGSENPATQLTRQRLGGSYKPLLPNEDLGMVIECLETGQPKEIFGLFDGKRAVWTCTPRLGTGEVMVCLSVERGELIHQATIHPLSGLRNRLAFETDLDRMPSVENGTYEAIVFIDVDNFGDFNSSLGHEIGDFVIREVGHATREQFRQIDMSYTYGGDEEVVRMREIPGEFAEAKKVVEQTTKLLQRRIARIKHKGKALGITVSIGVTLFESGETDLQQRIKEADDALYFAKETGRDRVCFFQEVDPSWLSERRKVAPTIGATEQKRPVVVKTAKSPA